MAPRLEDDKIYLEDAAFWAGLTRLGELGITGDGHVTFMSNSVAARLEDEAFWAGLTRLGELGITGDGLVTFMSGSVAARLEDEAFWAGLARLGELGITGDGLVSFTVRRTVWRRGWGTRRSGQG